MQPKKKKAANKPYVATAAQTQQQPTAVQLPKLTLNIGEAFTLSRIITHLKATSNISCTNALLLAEKVNNYFNDLSKL